MKIYFFNDSIMKNFLMSFNMIIELLGNKETFKSKTAFYNRMIDGLDDSMDDCWKTNELNKKIIEYFSDQDRLQREGLVLNFKRFFKMIKEKNVMAFLNIFYNEKKYSKTFTIYIDQRGRQIELSVASIVTNIIKNIDDDDFHYLIDKSYFSN